MTLNELAEGEEDEWEPASDDPESSLDEIRESIGQWEEELKARGRHVSGRTMCVLFFSFPGWERRAEVFGVGVGARGRIRAGPEARGTSVGGEVFLQLVWGADWSSRARHLSIAREHRGADTHASFPAASSCTPSHVRPASLCLFILR